MEEMSWILILLSWILFFCFSYVFIHFFLFKDYELRGKFEKILFSLTFSSSCVLLELFLLELSNFQVSEKIWKLSLISFSFLMLYFIPFCLLYKLIKFRYIFWVIFLICYYYLLDLNRRFIPHDANIFLHFSLSEQINLLGINGVIMSALLSGFGAINCTYSYFNFFNEDLTKENLKELVRLSKKNIESLVEAKISRCRSKEANSGWKNLWGVIGGNSKTDQKATEVKSLEVIHHQYLKHINDIIKNQERQKLRNSLKGRLFYSLGRLLTVYSIYKLITSTINFVFKRRYSLDPISRSLQIFSYIYSISPVTIEFISTYVSFGFIGILIFTNIRSFLLLLISLINLCARLISSGLSTSLLTIILSEVTGAYFMATVLLMRANLPEANRANITTVLSGIDFNTFHHMFDVTFALAGSITAVLLFIKHRLSIKSKVL